MRQFLECGVEAAQLGAVILRNHWGKIHKIDSKSCAGDLVTEADKKSEEVILAHIQKSFPDHSILSEESTHSPQDAEWLWVIDPLDGTTNYTHCYPMVAVSIALLQRGLPVIAVIYNPFFEELFTAVRGSGAYCGGDRLATSRRKTLAESLLASGFPYNRRTHHENNYGAFCYLTHLTQGVRRGGAASLDLAYVAAGKLDGYWEQGIQAWDIAAGALLVEEAGGHISGYSGEELDLFGGKIIATNGMIQDELRDALHASSAFSFSAPHMLSGASPSK